MIRWWLLKVILTHLIGDRPHHICRLDLVMLMMKNILRDEFTEDNLANTYWHIRQSLDDQFRDYLKVWDRT